MINLYESNNLYNICNSVSQNRYKKYKKNIRSDIFDKIDNQKLNILIIDDQEVCILSAEICFAFSQYNLISARSGEEGLIYMREYGNKINIVILDIMMPGIDGIEVLEIMKSDDNLKNIPVIISTGSELLKYKSSILGADFYLQKPYTKTEIFKAIDNIIESNKQMQLVKKIGN